MADYHKTPHPVIYQLRNSQCDLIGSGHDLGGNGFELFGYWAEATCDQLGCSTGASPEHIGRQYLSVAFDTGHLCYSHSLVPKLRR